MVTRRRYLVVGLPESGKSTFIAALWHVVQSNEIPSALRLYKMDGDRTYLNEIRDAWLQCLPMRRTSQQGEKDVRMLLADGTQRLQELWLPDMSGETFRQHWAHREWSAAYDGLIREAEGLLLFVRPETVVEPQSLALVNALVTEVSGATESVAVAEETQPAVPKPWDPIESPTQVQLVDLLQLLMWRRPTIRWRIAMVVSAWDEAKGLGLTPKAWFTRRLPLLSQFCRANEERLRLRYYGVSAQGGAFPEDAARLKALTLPSNRIEVVLESGSTVHDITLPVRELEDGD